MPVDAVEGGGDSDGRVTIQQARFFILFHLLPPTHYQHYAVLGCSEENESENRSFRPRIVVRSGVCCNGSGPRTAALFAKSLKDWYAGG